MKYIRKGIGIVMVSNIIPALTWTLYDYDYKPRGWLDTYINSFHPFIAGWMFQIMLALFVGIILGGVLLINPKIFNH